jgi:hypothetical protein
LPSLDTATWPLTLHKERQHYADLRQKYITSPASESENDSANDLSINNPLSLDQAVRIHLIKMNLNDISHINDFKKNIIESLAGIF